MYGLTDVTVRFGATLALDGVTLNVTPGQVVTVVGGDGAGKTTLLRALVGLVGLDSGSVRAPALDQIGYLPATTGSWLDLSVQENLTFAGAAYGLRGRALADRAQMLMESADLASVSDRLSRKLSGGMRRKLGFSLALMSSPALLVLDEPSTGVDPVSRLELWRLITHAAADGTAVLTSTTYLDEAERASHILVLDGGRAVIQGEPSAVVADFAPVVTEGRRPMHPGRAWRRGRVFHEVWHEPPPPDARRIEPDLEDVVIAMSIGDGA